ncbi:MAG: hypothetical protein ACRDBA_15565 [Clostridium sp.]
MYFLFEFILELLFEGATIASSNKKLSKYIRYPLICLLSFFFIIVCGGILFLGVKYLSVNKLMGITLICLSVGICCGSILKFKSI